jgi:hypothetical protein
MNLKIEHKVCIGVYAGHNYVTENTISVQNTSMGHWASTRTLTATDTPDRRKVRLIECNAKCHYLKKGLCGSGFLCLKPPPFL